MCRGCLMRINGVAATEEYCELFTNYTQVIAKVKSVEKEVLILRDKVDGKNDKDKLDQWHKAMVKARKQLAKTDLTLG